MIPAARPGCRKEPQEILMLFAEARLVSPAKSVDCLPETGIEIHASRAWQEEAMAVWSNLQGGVAISHPCII